MAGTMASTAPFPPVALCATELSSPAGGLIFNPEEALARCMNSPEMVREMIQFYFQEVDDLLPQLQLALEEGDVTEVGRLGHRIKGTVVYLAAEPATQAALRVEQYYTGNRDFPADITDINAAIDTLQRECRVLEDVLQGLWVGAERP